MSILCIFGTHARVLEGSGGMGDALYCLDCGRSKYPEVFGTALQRKNWPEGFWIYEKEKHRGKYARMWPDIRKDGTFYSQDVRDNYRSLYPELAAP